MRKNIKESCSAVYRKQEKTVFSICFTKQDGIPDWHRSVHRN